MNKNKKYLLIAIIITAIFIMFLVTILFQLNGNSVKNNKKDNINSNINSSTDNNQIDNSYTAYYYEDMSKLKGEYDLSLYYVENRTDYFAIEKIVNKYINLVNEKSNNLKYILSKQYISNYNINDSNIFEKCNIPNLQNDSQLYKLIINKMLTTQIDENTNIFIISGICRITDSNTKFDVDILIEIDNKNNTYAIFPRQYVIDNKFNNLNNNSKIEGFTKEEIIKNDFNEITYSVLNDNEVTNEYYNNYKELLINYEDRAYELLDDEYKSKKFGNKYNFINYIEKNTIMFSLSDLEKYKVIKTDNKIYYICIDSFGNRLIFKQQDGIMRYSVFLDSYTVAIPEENEDYLNLDVNGKAQYILSNIISMINTKDYKTIYNNLDNTFKENNFKNINELEKYIKENFYEINSLEINCINDDNDEYRAFECNIINMRDKTESKKATIVIKPIEENSFTMSFSVE
jgi:hypothetical protein